MPARVIREGGFPGPKEFCARAVSRAPRGLFLVLCADNVYLIVAPGERLAQAAVLPGD